MDTQEPSELEVTRVIGLLALRHPELMDRVDAATLRRMAREEFAAMHREPVPGPFLRAFAEPER